MGSTPVPDIDAQVERSVLWFGEIDRTSTAAVGGKGANLAELARIEGVHVPDGFCVTTDAFRRVLATVPSIDDLLDRLSALVPSDREAIRALSAELRSSIEAAPIPADAASAITTAVERLGGEGPYAVRSSATAEDSPTASFAGQHDSHLSVVGSGSVLRHISRCWASLFTERAVAYRMRNGFDHRRVHMAVVVQHLVPADASGVVFTADPVTSDRTVVAVEAIAGLGEAFVAGHAPADSYRVRGGAIVDARLVGSRDPVLTDGQVVRLAQLGRRIEAHFGAPQDVEWCLTGDDVRIVQSRPITTLFPIPRADDDELHVYVSVGHQQMMTDPMKPLGISMFQLTALPPMPTAGGRLFVDVAPRLASAASRVGLLDLIGKSDPLIRDALQTVLDRGVIPTDATTDVSTGDTNDDTNDDATAAPPAPIEADPAIVADLVAQNETSVATLEREIRTRAGTALIDLVLDDIQEMKRLLFDPRSHQAIMAGMEATWWLDERMWEWLGERNAAAVLSQSAPGNITSEMGLALLDVADAIRPHPEAVAYLRAVRADGTDDVLAGLADVDGGAAARAAIEGYLDRYGVRCVGEIDITRPRWIERPSALVPVILGNIEHFGPGAGTRRFEQGRLQAEAKERELLARLRELPDGESKASQTQRMIERLRTFIGYREYPKYGIVRRYFVYKQALLQEAERLVGAGTLVEPEDVFWLTFHELRDVMLTKRADRALIDERKQAFEWYRTLTPPRVLTSDGEAVAGAYGARDLPSGALAGLAVSSGTVEGRARVILDMADACVAPGDILVTAHTDPSWSPLFVTVAGLVTEVGGLMTHGSVIAREYGLPAVVGVEHATRLIGDGQRIRLNGTDGYVQILTD